MKKGALLLGSCACFLIFALLCFPAEMLAASAKGVQLWLCLLYTSPGAGRFDFQPLIRNGIQYILKGFTGVHDFRHINRVHIKMIDNSIQ